MNRKIILGIISGIILWAGFIFAGEISVNPATESLQSGNVFVITLSNLIPGDQAVKVFNSKGKYVRTILDKCSTETTIVVPWNLRNQWGKKVKPGQYTVKYLSGITFTLDKSFGKDGIISDTSIISPTDVQTDKEGNLYVLDEGASILYKYTPDGKPLKDINGKNFIESPTAPLWGSFCIGNDGRIYLPFTHSTSHVIGVYDGKTGALLYYIGGFGPSWKTTKGGDAYPTMSGINGNHFYADCSAYGSLWAWDARKPGTSGALWMLDKGLYGAITTNGKNIIYWATGESYGGNSLGKIIDQGTSGDQTYSIGNYTDPLTKTNVQLSDISGMGFDHNDGIYVVERKYSNIIKFSDTGFGFDYVTSFGSPGKNAEKLEFTAPHDVAISPDGHYIYVVEDGEAISKENTTPGLARIMKFKISYKEEKEIKLTVNP
jgi:DNA-binding beta-propeller fold protein YncE